MRRLTSGLCLAVAACATAAAAEPPSASGAGGPVQRLLSPRATTLSWRHDSLDPSGLEALRQPEVRLGEITFSSGPGRAESAGLGFLARYRRALERESRRRLEKDPGLLWVEPFDEEEYPAHGLQREAERIFAGAYSRLLSEMVEDLLDDAPTLKAARAYVEGVRLDVMNGGRVRLGSSGGSARPRRGAEEAGDPAAASFGVMVLGRPRLEMRATLPGEVRARLEVPLASPGLRASLSRRLTPRLRGALSGGVEDSGEDRWVSASLELRF